MNIWVPTHAQKIDYQMKLPGVFKVTDVPAPLEEREWTLNRILGEILFDTTGGSGGNMGLVYGLIFPDTIYGNDQPGTIYDADNNADRIPPSPLDNQGTDDFPLIAPICAPAAAPVAFPLDSKAKRRISKSSLLTIFCTITQGIASRGDTWAGKLAIIARALWCSK